MARVEAGAPRPYGLAIAVAGDSGTGKSSLIATVVAGVFPVNVPQMLPDTRLFKYFYYEEMPITVMDTSSRHEDRQSLKVRLTCADAIVLTYEVHKQQTIERLATWWFPYIRQLKVKVPIIVVGCKEDLKDEKKQVSVEEVLSAFLPDIQYFIECSAREDTRVQDVFFLAQKAALYPTGPLVDKGSLKMKPRLTSALKRIFLLCDEHKLGTINTSLLGILKVGWFTHTYQIEDFKRKVQKEEVEGFKDSNLTLTGFLFLHQNHIETGKIDITWTLLRRFGYSNDLKLGCELIPHVTKRKADQSVELTNEAVKHLTEAFLLISNGSKTTLEPADIKNLFSTAPESPWSEAPYKDAAEKTSSGGLSLVGFLSKWALMTLLDSASSLENLRYIGYVQSPCLAIRATRRRCLDRKMQRSERNVFQCFVFGPKKAGKSALLDSFLRRTYSDGYSSSTDDRYAVNVVNLPGGSKKTLVLREIPADGVKKLLSDKESLAACDIAVFVHDSCDEFSWEVANEMLREVASHGRNTCFEVPCLIIAAKADLRKHTKTRDSAMVPKDLEMVSVSSKSGNLCNVFQRIVSAAERPHERIPIVEARRDDRPMKAFAFVSIIIFGLSAILLD